MKLILKLAFKNVIGAGLRTWLNVGTLTLCFFFIVFYQGFINGWQNQAEVEGIQWEYGNGQLRNDKFDPSDPFSIKNGHGSLPTKEQQQIIPILVQPGSIFPQGRMTPIELKGIKTDQQLLYLPSNKLIESKANIPVIMGMRMAKSNNFKTGDEIMLRWRDKNGTYDASFITVVDIFNTNVVTVDAGQIWLPIEKLRKMTGLWNETTYFVANSKFAPHHITGWKWFSQNELLSDLKGAVMMERISSIIIYLVLLALALLAVFDTQVISIFRRQREIGTYISLGMTRKQVIGLFTAEGCTYSLLASCIGLVLGIPVFLYSSKIGVGIPMDMGKDIGIPISSRIFFVYTYRLILGTMALLVFSTILVSILPAKKIAKMNPVNALKGKIS